MAWYDTGTISVTNGSNTVTGSGTQWITGAQVGEAMLIAGELYEISAISSATSITLGKNYLGSTQSGLSYEIIPTQSLVADLASDVTDLISDYSTIANNAGAGKFNDGTETSPGITFNQDQDNGFYRSGSNTWAATVGGAQSVEFSSTGIDVTGGVKSSGLILEASSGGGAGSTTPVAVVISDTSRGSSWVVDSVFAATDYESADFNGVGEGVRARTGIAPESSSGAESSYVIQTAPNTAGTMVTRQKINANGDVSLYEDTGTTAKFFWDASAEKLNLSGSGGLVVTDNLLVGRSSNFSGAKAEIQTSDDVTTLTLNKNNTNDGEILRFAKSGTTVGSIGTEGGRLQIGKGGCGLYFYDSGPNLLPWNLSSNATADNSIDLGSSGTRFKDIYLSGSEYLGGDLVVGTTSKIFSSTNTENGFTFAPSGGYAWLSVSDTGGIYLQRQNNNSLLTFINGSTTVGNISVTGSATAYNTSSDYRLKEDVQPIENATERLLNLNPCNFAWKVDGSRVDGFLAHEAQEVVPEAVTGTKDAMRTEEYEAEPAVYEDVVIPAVEAVEAEYDEDGNIVVEAVEAQEERTESVLVSEAVMAEREVPDYQGIDQAKLVPLLVATVQELEARIKTLENAQ